jgi:hypothetical protein
MHNIVKDRKEKNDEMCALLEFGSSRWPIHEKFQKIMSLLVLYHLPGLW